MRTREWRYGQNAIVATVRVEPHHSHACWQAFLPTGPLVLLPLALMICVLLCGRSMMRERSLDSG